MNQKYLGLLIRKYRLENNYSLEGLSKGICALSYLSKIEKGTVCPSDEIICRLFEALGVRYEQDESVLEAAAKKLAAYFDGRRDFFPVEEEITWLKERLEGLKNSLLFIDMSLFEIMEWRKDIADEGYVLESWEGCFRQKIGALERFKEYMSDEQLFWLYDLKFLASESQDEGLSYARKMCMMKKCSYAYRALLVSYNNLGMMMQAREEGEKGYTLACDEGNVWLMAEISVLIGNIYSNCGEIELMMKYYDRALKITRFVNYDTDIIFYNIGATCIEYGEYKEGIDWLLKIKDQAFENGFLYCHKMVIAYGELDDKEKCKFYFQRLLAATQKEKSDCQGACMIKMCHMLRIRYFEDYVHNQEYEKLLKDTYDNIQDAFGYGYKHFHQRFLMDLYKKQRRYKEALMIEEQDNDFHKKLI